MRIEPLRITPFHPKSHGNRTLFRIAEIKPQTDGPRPPPPHTGGFSAAKKPDFGVVFGWRAGTVRAGGGFVAGSLGL